MWSLRYWTLRINSHDPEKRFIRLEKGEIERLLGVSQIRPDDLEKRIDNLFQTVTIRDKNKSKRFCKISLFEKAKCYRDEDGLWQVDLGASPCAMEYIFNPERLGYLRYNLRNVVKLNSRYSYVLFLYLEQNRHMHFSLKSALLAYTRYRQIQLSMLLVSPPYCHKNTP